MAWFALKWFAAIAQATWATFFRTVPDRKDCGIASIPPRYSSNRRIKRKIEHLARSRWIMNALCMPVPNAMARMDRCANAGI